MAARQQLADRDAAIAAGTPGFYLEVELPPQNGQASTNWPIADRRWK